MRARRHVAVAAAALLLLGACDRSVDEEQTVPEEPEAPDLGERPDIAAMMGDDLGEPPDDLVVDDIVLGEGDQAQPGDTVSVQYVGVAWSTQEEFDASWDRGQPFSFTLGEGRVIEGWDRGVEGMQVGGRRSLTIPPELAYGERGVGGVIAPGETLVFVVDLLEVQPGAGG
jgi:peptidylprolyl isomerase